MKPVRVSIDVPQAREDVYDFLDVLANHELFTDRMLRDWRCEGPARGVGAKAKMSAVSGGRTEALDMEVIDAEPPLPATRNSSRESWTGYRWTGQSSRRSPSTSARPPAWSRTSVAAKAGSARASRDPGSMSSASTCRPR